MGEEERRKRDRTKAEGYTGEQLEGWKGGYKGAIGGLEGIDLKDGTGLTGERLEGWKGPNRGAIRGMEGA